MQSAIPVAVERPGRRVRSSLRENILSGHFPPGELLPSVRELSERFEVARKTVNMSLKALEHEGFVRSEPRRGFRVQPGACDPERGCPVAFVDWFDPDRGESANDSWDCLLALREGARKHGWPLLSVGASGRDPHDVLGQVLAARACGIVLSAARGVARLAKEAGVPCVIVDWWEEDEEIDTILQDDFLGGVLAARYFMERGHERVAWIGPTTDNFHSMSRWGGACAELARGGRPLAADLTVSCDGRQARAKARELLARPDRPRAVLALWSRVAIGVLDAARELGLRPGMDFEMVGWAREDVYHRDYVPAFGIVAPQPAIVWSGTRMGELAIERLAARRMHPLLAPVKICVPVRLVRAE